MNAAGNKTISNDTNHLFEKKYKFYKTFTLYARLKNIVDSYNLLISHFKKI